MTTMMTMMTTATTMMTTTIAAAVPAIPRPPARWPAAERPLRERRTSAGSGELNRSEQGDHPLKSLLATLALTTALTLPGLAMARPVTLTTTLNNYGGDGAYLALYVTDPSGAYVGSLWMAGGKSKYYKHLSDWYRATGGDTGQVNGICRRTVH
jgi:hypothetical protein